MSSPIHRTPPTIAIALSLVTGCASAPPPSSGNGGPSWTLAEMAEPRQEPERLPPLDGGSLESMLDHARRHHPGLQAAFLRWSEALEAAPQVSALPEPRLTLAGYLTELETRVGPMKARVGLSQRVPWMGVRAAREEGALEVAEALREDLEERRLVVEASLREAWYERIWLLQAISVADGHLELLSQWESVARTRLDSGLGPHSDLIRTQIELGKLDVRARTMRDMLLPVEARMNAILGRPSGAPLPPPATDWPAIEELDVEALRSGLPQTSPALRSMEHRIQAARHGVEVARKRSYPDFVLGAEYAFVDSARMPGVSGSGDDPFALTLGLDLPLWGRANDARTHQAEAGERAARFDREQMLRSLETELETAFFDHGDALRRLELYRDTLIPKGEESLHTLEAAYRVGEIGFLDLVDAQRTLLEFQLQSARADADRAQALAEIERITGVAQEAAP